MGFNRRLLNIQAVDSILTPVSFSATSTYVTDWHDTIQGAAYNPSDGYLYTLERADSNLNCYLIRRNPTTGAYISVIGHIGQDKFGLTFDSNGYFWSITRASISVIRKYNTSLTYQNVQFNVTGYYANDVAIDSNDILYVTREGSSTVYSYNTSGTSQGNFSLGGTNDPNIFHAEGRLWRGGNAQTWFGRTIATSTNDASFSNNNPYGNNNMGYASWDSDNKILWSSESISGTGNVIRKYTPNY